MFQKLLREDAIVKDLGELERAFLTTFQILEEDSSHHDWRGGQISNEKTELLETIRVIQESINENNKCKNFKNNQYNLIVFSLMACPMLSNYTNITYPNSLRNIFLGEELLETVAEDVKKMHELIVIVAKKLSENNHELLKKIRISNIFFQNYYLYSNEFYENCDRFIDFNFNIHSYRDILHGFNAINNSVEVDLISLLKKYIKNYEYYSQEYEKMRIKVEEENIERRFKSLFSLVVKVEGLNIGCDKRYIEMLLEESDVIDAWLSRRADEMLLLFLNKNISLNVFVKIIKIIRDEYPDKKVLQLTEALAGDKSLNDYEYIKSKRFDVIKFIEHYDDVQPLDWQVELLIVDGGREYYE